MLKSFQETNFIDVFLQARKIAPYETIRDTFLASLITAESFTAEQKLAIRLAGIQMRDPGHMESQIDDLLMDILNITWEDVEAGGVAALLPEQRVGILNGIMAVCQGIIAAEAARLESISTLPTVLPDDWDAPDPEPEPEPEPEEEETIED